MKFEDFITWIKQNINEWQSFPTLGEVKKKREGKALKKKSFLAKYNNQQNIVLFKLPKYDEEGKTAVKTTIGQLQTIFDRFMEASPADKISSSYYQIQIWKEAPNKIATPAIAAIIWYWYDLKR
ncbi:MAG: hypothetical protein C0399_04050 [Syntrophus sp. (in: bacteria)]|nr:hypothetical protein [Syntrophus sp. (in: bacteria)]